MSVPKDDGIDVIYAGYIDCLYSRFFFVRLDNRVWYIFSYTII